MHHGELSIEDNAPGLRVIISLPAASAALYSAPALPQPAAPGSAAAE
jgi:hypothetical protein